MQLDRVDSKIVEMLKDDARESFVDLGKKLDLSESSVRRRVKTMLERGIIKKFTVELGDVNDSTKALALLSVDSMIDTVNVTSKLKQLSGVKTVYEITGQYDIVVMLSAPNISLVNETIDALRKVDGVVDTNTIIILSTIE